MKKQEKIDAIRRGIDEKLICRCSFKYENNYFYCFPNAVNDKLFLCQEEDDFALDGYCIRKLSDLEHIEVKNDKCSEICRLLGVTGQVRTPDIDISSWHSIFTDLAKQDVYVQIEECVNGEFFIGSIEKVYKDRLYLKVFDADGEWYDEAAEIRYSKITTLQWETRYAVSWKRYMDCTRTCVKQQRS